MQGGCSPVELVPQVGHQPAPVAGRVPGGGCWPSRTAVISPFRRECSPLKLSAHMGGTAFSVPYRSGRPGRPRPCNLLDVDQALYSLSHRSIWWTVTGSNRYLRRAMAASSRWTNSPLVDLAGDAPATSALPARRSPNRELKAQATVMFSRNHCDAFQKPL